MKKLAIVGATGLVGQTILRVLNEENMLCEFEVFLFVSQKSAGKVLVFNNNHYRLIELNDHFVKFNLDYAIFAVESEISKDWVPKFIENGIVVIDNSSYFRLNNSIPLIVPEINLNSTDNFKLLANPNCSTIQLVLVLDRLKKLSGFETVVVSSYQSVSGAGRLALLDLENGTSNYFVHGIKDNFVANIGNFDKNGNCSEENKIILETQKILNDKFKIVATSVRVPISYCHGESVYVKFKNDINFENMKSILNCDYLTLSEDVIFPIDCTGTNKTFVFRMRKISNCEISFFVLADNLRRGAAYNAVKILKKIKK